MIHLRLPIISSFSIIFIVSIFPTPVYAYLDPGTGSYFFQILVGTIIGALFTVKMFWKKIKDFFKGRKEDE